jgi:hypothetical protein
MGKLTGPTIVTIKRLFAVAGNRCAFPQCTQPLVHSGKVTGRACHIKAAKPGGPRFDRTQTDEQRRGFDNLVLMCPVHHDVIDADPLAYTVAQLTQMKGDHEARHAGGAEPTDEVANQFVINLSEASVGRGSIIVTHNQTGGQVAHVINNYGPPKRLISPEIRGRMLDVLQRIESSRIGFASTQGDMEAHEFKEQLMDVFRTAGWEIKDMHTFMFFGARKGIILTIPIGSSEASLPQTVAHALAQTGTPVACNHGDMANACGLYVQVWHAP